MPTLQEQFDAFTTHITDPGQKQLVFDYITRFPGLSFDTSIDDYLLTPAPSLTPGFEPGFTAAFRWGNWVGAGTGAARFSNHQDFTPAEFLVSARDVFDAIGRTHDLSIFQASSTLTNALNASGGNYVVELEAVRQFLLERAEIDADFSDAVSAMGLREGLVGYEVQIRELGLAIMEWGAEGYAAAAEDLQDFIDYYLSLDAGLQADLRDLFDPEEFREAERASFDLLDEIGAVVREFRQTAVPSQDLINSAARNFDQILLGNIALPGVGVFYPDDRANARNEFLNEFETVFGSEARQRLIEALEESCFVAGTPITLWDGSIKAIEDISRDDVVLAFDVAGRAVPGVVDKLFVNTTQQLVEVSFDGGLPPLVTTPGHSFLTETGLYVEIGQLMTLGGGAVRLVDAQGRVVTATARLIEYEDETAHLFEQSGHRAVVANGGPAHMSSAVLGWTTYNFEVRDHHNYVAGDIRVHNDSILSKLEANDIVVASNDDLTQVAVLRDVDGDGDLDVVVIEGARDAAGNADTQVIATNVYLDNGESYALSTGGTGTLAERVQDVLSQSFARGAADGVTSADGPDPWNNGGITDDFEELLFDDVVGLSGLEPATRVEVRALYSQSEVTIGDQTVAVPDVSGATDPVSLLAALSGVIAVIDALAPADVRYQAGTGDKSVPPFSGISGVQAVAFLLGIDLGVEILPAVTVDGPFGPVEVSPALTLGDVLDGQVQDQTQFNIVFGTGIAPADVSKAQDGDDLVMTIAGADGSTSTFTLQGVYADGGDDEVAAVLFEDGGSLSLDQVPETAQGDGIVSGTTGNDVIDASYTDVDGDVVSAAADTINGGQGDDVMAGGAGDDSYDGGDGRDTVRLDGRWDEFVFAANGAVLTVTDTNTANGLIEGSDTLTRVEALEFSDGQSATISEGAERTTIRVDDSAGTRVGQIAFDTGNLKTWASYTQTFAADGVTRTDQINLYDDGRVLDIDFSETGLRTRQVFTDAQNTKGWATIETTFNAEGSSPTQQIITYDDGRVVNVDVDITYASDGVTRVSQVNSYDDGRVLEIAYDAEGVRSTQTWRDTGDSQPWDRIDVSFAADGATKTDQFYTYDDGRILDMEFDANGIRTSQLMTDVENVKDWSTLETFFAEDGRTQTTQIITYDDGRVVNVDVDVTYAADGRTLVDQVKTYDDGRVLDIDYDANGLRTSQIFTDTQDAFVWTTIVATFAADGRTRTDQIKTYDDGRVLDVDYDANGLRTSQTMTDVENVYSWASYTQTFDAEGNLLSTVYVDDPILG